MIQAALVVELLARGIAVGAFVALAIALVRGASGPVRASGVLFCLAAGAHTLTQWPGPESILGFAQWPVWGLSAMGAGFFWAFARDLFEDTPADWRRFIPAVALLAVGIAGRTAPEAAIPGIWLLHNLIGAVLVLHILALIAAGWRGDLVEQRRRIRIAVLLAGATYALVITLVQTGELLVGSAERLSPLAAAALMTMSLVSMWAFGRVDAQLFAAPAPASAPAPEPPAIGGADAVVAAELDRLMRVERLYREEGLTISSLALRLRVPEHRLRQLINQKLGHRSFSAYLNQWRLAEAKAALAEPDQASVPISTIALDAGFGSLGPFNRAFKAATGLTPTEFRDAALNKASGVGAKTQRSAS
ncbi:MAG: helix-turn-helix domain-containing protein [Hyphomonadaceae bacterium]